MEAQGIVTAILPVTTYGKEGKKKGGFVIEIQDGKFTDNLAFECLEKALIDITDLSVGDEVNVKFSVRSREWQGKWYTNATAFGVNVKRAQQQAPPSGDNFRVPDNSDIGNIPF